MKFYLCQTEVGPQYVHLQADAKKIDPKFETVEVDLNKQPIMDRLNELMRLAHATTVAPAAASSEEQQDTPPASAAPPAPKPKPQAMPPHAARNDAQIAWEEFIWDIPAKEVHRLDALRKVIDGRQAEITEGLAA